MEYKSHAYVNNREITIRQEDRDLDRILKLYEIIKRYELLVEHLLDNTISFDTDVNYHKCIERLEKQLIHYALDNSKSNEEAYNLIGMNRKTFYNRLREFGINKKQKPEYEVV